MKSIFRSIQRFTSVFVVLLGCYVGWNADHWFDVASNIVSANPESEVPPIPLKVALANPASSKKTKRWPEARSATLIDTAPEPTAPEVAQVSVEQVSPINDTELALQLKKNRNVKSEINKLATQENLSFEEIANLNEIAHDPEVNFNHKARALRILYSHISSEEWTEISKDIDANLLEAMENSNSILAEDLLDEK